MQEALHIESTEDTPAVDFDKANNTFEISGRSLPEDVFAFYQPVMKWLDEYAKDPNYSTTLVIALDYINSASGKVLFDLLAKLENINGKFVKIKFNIQTDNEVMAVWAEEISDMLHLPVSIFMTD